MNRSLKIALRGTLVALFVLAILYNWIIILAAATKYIFFG